ncbi:leucine-rich repeat-containing protein 63 isoform X2 [Tupaia chinensis]|nr:leucine-rich repeat-containing protein 63 isoform X2 [Tupaia chinensis]XP_006163506.1 leucine-rich repeat-containing protein 63 isoform X2 [Tupaia chinensis]
MPKQAQLFRRPLPPKFKLSLHKKKILSAKTDETESSHVEFTLDKTDKISFPVVPRNLSQTSVDFRNFLFDRHLQESVTSFLKSRKSKKVYWYIPDTAAGSIFFPTCTSASSRIFGKGANQLEKKSKKEPNQTKNTFTDKKLEDVLILSSEFRKPLPTTKKEKKVHQPLSTSARYAQNPLSDLRAIVPSSVRGSVSDKPEKPGPEHLLHTTTVVLNISEFPGHIAIPTVAAVPRKPRRQSAIEYLVANLVESENGEFFPKQVFPRIPEGYAKTRSKESDENVLRGEGFKTIAATRYETLAAMTNLAIVNCQLYGRNALSLKGFFISNCPDLTPLAFQLIYLNLSFNHISCFPPEVFCLKHLQILKLRNNPIKEIPSEIQQLKFLRIFNIAFNYIADLPPGLFSLSYLEELDVSYNNLTFIPNAIQKLRSLDRLNVDGNELCFLPPGILKLNLTKIQIDNNYTHPCFWKENSLNSSQRLTQISALFIVKNNIHTFYDVIPAEIQKLLKCTSKCDWCHGPKFGEGLRIILSCDIFGALQLPIMFYVCSSSCYKEAKESSFILLTIPDKRISLNVELSEER